jgi:hypothetical protein
MTGQREHGVERPGQVAIEDLVPGGGGLVGILIGVDAAGAAGAGDDDVDAPQRAPDPIEGRCEHAAIGDVGALGGDGVAGVGGLGQAVGIAPEEAEPDAVGGQSLGDRAADARTGAGDDGGSVIGHCRECP